MSQKDKLMEKAKELTEQIRFGEYSKARSKAMELWSDLRKLT